MSLTILSASLPVAVDVISTLKNSIEAVKIWFDLKDRNQAKQKLNEQALEITRNEDSVREEANNVVRLIPENILTAFQKRINECKIKYERVLNSPDDYFEEAVDSATRAYIKCICRELNRVFEINKSVPEGEMKNFWDNYSCYSSSPFKN